MCEEKVREVWEKVGNVRKSEKCDKKWDMWEKVKNEKKVKSATKSEACEKKGEKCEKKWEI